jgi:hypothetical protein
VRAGPGRRFWEEGSGTMKAKLAILLVGAAVLAGGVGGCGRKSAKNDRVTKDNFAKVRTGMTESDVTGLLGRGLASNPNVPAGAKERPDLKVLVWEDGPRKKMSVSFIDGKVVAKAKAGF